MHGSGVSVRATKRGYWTGCVRCEEHHHCCVCASGRRIRYTPPQANPTAAAPEAEASTAGAVAEANTTKSAVNAPKTERPLVENQAAIFWMWITADNDDDDDAKGQARAVRR